MRNALVRRGVFFPLVFPVVLLCAGCNSRVNGGAGKSGQSTDHRSTSSSSASAEASSSESGTGTGQPPKIASLIGNITKLRVASSSDEYVRHQEGKGRTSTNVPIASDAALTFLDTHFSVTKPLDDAAGSGCVSFESLNYPGYYLSQASGSVSLLSNDSSADFKKNASLCARTGLSDSTAFSFAFLGAKDGEYICAADTYLVVSSPSNAANCTFHATLPPASSSEVPALPTTIDYGSIQSFGDPAGIQAGDTYYAFASNLGIQMRTSKDLIRWETPSPKSLFSVWPEWLTRILSNSSVALGAPDISYSNGQYHLAYAYTHIGLNTTLVPVLHSNALGSSAQWYSSYGKSGAVSFQSLNYPSYFIRHSGNVGLISPLYTDKDNAEAKYFTRYASAVAPSGCSLNSDTELVRLESSSSPGTFLRHRNSVILLSSPTDDGSTTFCEDSMFRIKTGAQAGSISFETYQWKNVYIRHRFGKLFIDYISASGTDLLDRSFFTVKDMSLLHQTTYGSSTDNALDPNLLHDDDGRSYVVYGSYYGGIYLMEVDPKSLLRKSSAAPVLLARPPYFHSPNVGPIEAPFLIKRGKYYYLFSSYGDGYTNKFDYHLGMGRSTTVEGPYLTIDGKRLDEGKYSPLLIAHTYKNTTGLLRSDTAYENVGHNGLIRRTAGDDFLLYHYGGINKDKAFVASEMHVRRLLWPEQDGWPSSSTMRYAGEPEKSVHTPAQVAGTWAVKVGFAKEVTRVRLQSDHTIEGYEGMWFVEPTPDGTGTYLFLVWKNSAATHGYYVDATLLHHTLNNESTPFVQTIGFAGHNQEGIDIRGVRVSD